MAKRRGKGEGCISKRKDKNGKVVGWCAVTTGGINPKTGKTKQVLLYGKTREEVQEKLIKALAEKQAGVFVEPSKLKVGDWLDKWLNDRMKNHLRPTTWDSYKYLIDTHIKPAICNLQLKNLTSTHPHDLYNAKIAGGRSDGAGGLSSRTVRYIHTVIHAALKQAVREGLLAQNVVDNVVIPKQHKKEMRVLTREETERFLTAIENDRLYAAFLLDLTSGLRVGELLALRWKDVDLKEGIIHVRRGLVKIRNQEGETKTKTAFHEPKSKQGKRDIPIPEDVVKELRAHRARQNQEKLLLGQEYQDNDLVFCTVDGKPIEPRNFTRTFHRMIKKAGIPHANLHALRHTYATRLLEANEHPKVVQELLGHSQISMTLDTYSHVGMDLKRKAAEKLAGLVKEKAW
ncbi:hypothetical protein SY88_09670 [Clostridiales bacterium PH28_bin88]|nr:hypothetical protein SY88_09670 [Clostridiales bacterium PH28_bin88]